MTPEQNRALDVAQALVPELERKLERKSSDYLHFPFLTIGRSNAFALIAALQLLPALRKENEELVEEIESLYQEQAGASM